MKPLQKHLISLAAMAVLMTCGNAAELHVASTGNDASPGTPAAPLRTIQRGADIAQPGDTVTVHAGVYRERVNPPRGGESATKRIVYQAASGEQVVITGSEAVKKWEKVQDRVWKATLPNTFFGSFNPFAELISGDWFDAKDRSHHAGAVYLNGDWLTEAVSLEEVMKPMTATPLWFASVDTTHTVIWAQFKDVFFQGTKPSKHESEPINRSASDPGLTLVEKNDGFYLTMTLATALGSERPSQPVTSARLGKASISGCAFENPDGSPITIGTDYFGKPRNAANPTPGPFEAPGPEHSP